MKTSQLNPLALLLAGSLLSLGCATDRPTASHVMTQAWPGELAIDDPDSREVTVIIALSSLVPGGIIGHCGIAVDNQYWDFGPERVQTLQPIKSMNSVAGPWWDDPDQRWQNDRTLNEVLNDVPDKVHPTGSILAVVRVEVTDEQADALIAFWDQTYQRMQEKRDRYRLHGRQCANMVGWSLAHALDDSGQSHDRLPAELRMMTPTRLYESLRDSLHHTAGPRIGQRADLTLWQLGPKGMQPWQRPRVWQALGIPELPRTRLAIERMKFLPVALAE